jgi:PKD repeat protein
MPAFFAAGLHWPRRISVGNVTGVSVMGFVPFLKRALGATLWVGVMAAVAGCPTKDMGLALITNPKVLDFGDNTASIRLNVRTNFSTSTPEPLIVKSSAPWIQVDECLDASEGCLVGTITESINLQIRVDRTKTVLGTNRGTLTLEVRGASRVVLDVVAEDELDPDFSVPARRVGVGAGVQFQNTSAVSGGTGSITSYLWDFGDGSTSSLASPMHTYGKPGVYTVSLTITTPEGTETFTRENYIVVGDPQPLPDFAASPREIFTGETVQFSDLTTSLAGPIVSRSWDFGDGATSSAVNPTHQYTKSGIFTVKLTVNTEFASATKTREAYVLVKRKGAPQAVIGLNTVNPHVGDVIQFMDASEPGSAPITQWVWNFGDGGVSTKQNPTHIYDRAGDFKVTLTVISASGSSQTELTLKLGYAPPKPDFEALQLNPSTCSDLLTCPEAVQFVDRSHPGSGAIREWLWDFGDGTTSREQNPRHGYTRVGTYDVSLTITTTAPQDNTATVTKRNLIVAVDPPRPDFSLSTQSVFTNTNVTFNNRTRIGTEKDVSYEWDFDGNANTVTDRSTETSPTYRYPNAGTFTPTLTASTATRSEKTSRSVVVDSPTVADFIVSSRTPTTSDTVTFTDKTSYGTRGTGGTVSALRYRWDFGDGSISELRNPTHQYRVAGVYPVTLTVTYAHSGTGVEFTSTKTQAGFITVSLPAPPSAAFSVLNTDCIFAGDTLRVRAAVNNGGYTYQWDFGDPGTPGNTQGTVNANKQYLTPGTYTVSLTVTNPALDPPFDRSTETLDIVVAEETPLDQYVRELDPNYAYNQVGQPISLTVGLLNAGTAYNLYMKSGNWRTNADVQVTPYNGLVWKHNVTIIDPVNREHDTAILLISGGSRFDDPPTREDLFDISAPELGLVTASPIVILDDVPAQPIRFVGENIDRTEDAIIAYSFDAFLDDYDANRPVYPEAGADEPWPLLFPMARAAVRAMDTAQDFLGSRGSAIDDFIVTGASKRGWTTWLTGITDCRVKAMAPVVIDLLNTDESMIHHRNSLANQRNGTTGGFSDAVADYTAFGIFQRLASTTPDAAGQELLRLVDPYEYRERAIMPKLLLNATGDEFFLSDSARFYINDLYGETNLSYIPNVGHGLGANAFDIGDNSSALYVLTSWILGILQDVERPTVNWAFPDDNTIVVNLDDPSGQTPEVRLWSINNSTYRDFRKPVTDALGRQWTSQVLQRQPNGTYVGRVNTPDTGWTAYYIQVRFDSDATPEINIPGIPRPEFVFSTPIRIVPDIYPSAN